MKLPKEIQPDPILTSIVEIRFKSNLDKFKLFNIISDSLSEEFPILNNIERSQKPIIVYTEYEMLNDDYSFSFGDGIISFKNVSKYKLWDNYFAFIKKIINILYKLDVFIEITRIGIRYISLFDDTVAEEVLKEVPSINVIGENTKFGTYGGEFKVNNSILTLIITAEASALKGEVTRKGTVFDIDSFSKNVKNNAVNVLETIDSLHSDEKTFFFNLLSPEFIESLSPTY